MTIQIRLAAGLFAAAAFLGAPAAFAQAQCAAINQAIDDGLKAVADASASGIVDNSAPRETNRGLRQLIALQRIQMNLTLLQANKCALPQQPFLSSDYYESALNCELESINKPKSNQTLPECERANWKRSASK